MKSREEMLLKVKIPTEERRPGKVRKLEVNIKERKKKQSRVMRKQEREEDRLRS